MTMFPGEGTPPFPDQQLDTTGPNRGEHESLQSIEGLLDEIAFANTTTRLRRYSVEAKTGESLEVKTLIAPGTGAITLQCTVGDKKYEISQHSHDSDMYTLTLPRGAASDLEHNPLEPFQRGAVAEIPVGLNRLMELYSHAQSMCRQEDKAVFPIDTAVVQELWAGLDNDADALQIPTLYRLNTDYTLPNGTLVDIIALTDTADMAGHYIPTEQKITQQLNISTRRNPSGDFTFVRNIYDGKVTEYYFLDAAAKRRPSLSPEEHASNPYQVLPDIITGPDGALKIVYYLYHMDRDSGEGALNISPDNTSRPFETEAEAQASANSIRAIELVKERATKAGVTPDQLHKVIGVLKSALEVAQKRQEDSEDNL